MPERISVKEAAAEVQAAKDEMQAANQDLNKAQEVLFNADRRVELANIRFFEAQRVLLEAASE